MVVQGRPRHTTCRALARSRRKCASPAIDPSLGGALNSQCALKLFANIAFTCVRCCHCHVALFDSRGRAGRRTVPQRQRRQCGANCGARGTREIMQSGKRGRMRGDKRMGGRGTMAGAMMTGATKGNQGTTNDKTGTGGQGTMTGGRRAGATEGTGGQGTMTGAMMTGGRRTVLGVMAAAMSGVTRAGMLA